MNQTRKTQSAPNLSGYSRIPSVSRAIPFACRGRSVDANSQLQVEFIGGTARWRFVEDEDEVPKSQKKHSKQVACSYARPSSKPCLHEVTIAGGWGQKSAREKRLEKLASKLGYLPGMPRMKGRLVVVLVRFSSGVQGWLEQLLRLLVEMKGIKHVSRLFRKGNRKFRKENMPFDMQMLVRFRS